MIRSKITDRWQTTIPAVVRRALKLNPKQRLTYEIRDEGVLLKPETETLLDFAGSLKSKVLAKSKKEERSDSRKARMERYL